MGIGSSFWIIGAGRCFYIRYKYNFFINTCCAGVWRSRARTIHYQQIWIIAGWRPRSAWPVPNQGFIARLSGNIPHLFSTAICRIKTIYCANNIVWILSIKAGESMNVCISAR